MINPRNELYPLPTWGCDPEGLIRNPAGLVVGAEEVVPPEGIIKTWGHLSETGFRRDWAQQPSDIPVLFPDGVQLEFNVNAYDCVAYTVNALAQSMRLLKGELAKGNHTLDLTTKATVITDDVWERLSPRGKQLGSLPSFNAYGDEPLQVTDENRKLRTGAGHIHFGFNANGDLPHDVDSLKTLAKICDRIVGIPSVMIDVDPDNATRRTMYGRAGEFRPQPHGFEYRTPSNFWLTSGPLAGFIFGAARLALAIYRRELKGEKLLDKIGMSDDLVKLAINSNDVALATRLYNDHLKPFILQNVGAMDGLWPRMLPTFEAFAQMVQEKGLAHFWPDPLTHWCELPEAHAFGWTWFMTSEMPRVMGQLKRIA